MKNKSKNTKEHKERERSYTVKIPSREQLLELLSSKGQPVRRRIIVEHFELNEAQEEALSKRLHAMTRDGQLIRNRKGAFGLAKNMDLVRGRIHAHPDGYGFLLPDAKGDDLYLAPRQMRRVMHGDQVLACITGIDARGRKEGAIVEILERAHQHVVGRYLEESGIAFVVPDDPRLTQHVMLAPGKTMAARPGQIVVVRLDSQPDDRQPPMGHVEEILGRSGAPGLAVEIAIRNFDLPVDFPDEAIQQAEDFGESVTSDQLKGRKDLRDLPLVTIDGADARDFDDAVYCSRQENGWRLVVAIAAVSAYVKPGSPLDNEATRRGTSVYFPNRVIPMLPEALSNGLCSLKPKVDRLCMVCDMQVSDKGKVGRSRFFEAVMHSHARLTYGQAQDMLDRRESPLREKDARVTESVDQLLSMYKAFSKQRRRRGAIDFHSTEVRFQFGANGEVSAIQPFHRHTTHKIIEECMIAANVEAARFLDKNHIPAPYRVHEPPPDGKLESLTMFLRGQGLTIPWQDKPEPRDISRLIEQVADRPDRDLVEAVLLRSQSLAAYMPESLGHFGLALEAYAHFTSPIRRYADLLVHRAIAHVLDHKPIKKFAYDEARIRELSERCSNADRRAEEASRDVDERLKAAFMEGHVGDVFAGTVTGVTSFGLFIELDENRVSGLLHVTSLPNDYYNFDPVAHRLTGKRGGKVFRLADQLSVEVLAVNSEERKVDFGLAGKNAKKG